MKNNKGCKYCNIDSNEREIYYDESNGEWYIDIETLEWDYYNDENVHEQLYIKYCPYCGRLINDNSKFFPAPEF